MRMVLIALASIGVSTAAMAGVQFSIYDGPNAVQTGTGGAKIVKNGVDFWTEGTPPRRYQVLGFLTDTRRDGALSRNAIGSSGLAKRVRAAGGDALIVANQSSEAAGVVAMVNLDGPSWGRTVHKVTTRFLVVRYLPN